MKRKVDKRKPQIGCFPLAFRSRMLAGGESS